MESAAAKSVADEREACGLTREDIFSILKGHLNDKATETYAVIENVMSAILQGPFALSDNAKPVLRKLLHDMHKKWQQASRTEEFAKSSDETKQRRTEELRARHSMEELTYTTQMNLRSSGKSDAAKIVSGVELGSPSKAKKYKESIDAIQETTLSADAALSLIEELKLSKSQYQGLRNRSNENSCNLFPPYKLPYQAKLKCYSPKSDISVNEYSAEVKLQAPLNHTADRILLTQMNVVKSLSPQKVLAT